MKINVDWQGEMEFKNQLPSGHELTVDAAAESGGHNNCLLYTSPSPRDRTRSRMPSSA